jgi:hypothetical protein
MKFEMQIKFQTGPIAGTGDKSLTAYLSVSLLAEARKQWRHGLDVAA